MSGGPRSFAEAVGEYYPELREVMSGWPAPGKAPEPDVVATACDLVDVFGGDHSELEKALATLNATSVDALLTLYTEVRQQQLRPIAGAVGGALLDAFTLGLWLGELGLVRVRR